MPKGLFPRGSKKTHVINGVQMSKLKHDRIRAFEAMLPQLDERERLNSEDVASRLGVSGVTICSWLRVLGRRLLNNNGRTFFAWDKSNWHKTVLPVYKKTGSSYAAAKAVGVNSTTVYRWLSNNGHLKRKYRERDISSFKFQSYR